MPDPQISVIVVNYNSGNYLSRCLDSLCRQQFADFEVFVVDNFSDDDSFCRARETVQDSRFHFRKFDRNLGFAAANNRAAAGARGKWIALLNPDAFAEQTWLAALTAAAERLPDVDMFGSTQIAANDPATLDGAGDAYLAIGVPWRGGHGHPVSTLPPEREVFAPCAAAGFYRAEMFRRLNGFDESFFCYCEDVDLAFRARLYGARSVQVPAAVVLHVGGGSAGMKSSFARYHGIRNMIWTFVKNMPAALFWPLLPLHLTALLLLLLRDMTRGDAAVSTRAIRDAIDGLPAVWRSRQRVQSARTAGTWQIARALSWRVDDFGRRTAR